jgi:hypothetical protein
LSDQPVAAIKPEAQQSEAVPVPGFTTPTRPWAWPCPREDAWPRHRNRSNSLPAWIRPCRMPSRLTSTDKTERPAASRQRARSETAVWKGGMVDGPVGKPPSFPAACPPASTRTASRTTGRSKAGRSPAHRLPAGRHAEAIGPRPLESKTRAAHLPRASRRCNRPNRKGNAPGEPGRHAHAVACMSSWSSTSASARASARASCSRNITGNHPVPAASRSASLAICAFFSFASR